MRKNIIITLICILVVGLYSLNYFYNTDINTKATVAYNVYFKGEKLGLIKSEQELYDLINEEQSEIKVKYDVDNVYPPNGFYLSEVNTYSDNYSSVSTVYNAIAEKEDFTIKGYIVSIASTDEDVDDIVINVLDKQIFEDAIKKFILAFISEDDYNKYMNNEFGTLTDIGQIIQDMKFSENITIKEGYISVNDKIYTDVDSLSQYLLFGEYATQMESYVVKLGDSIESISEENKLNPQEFIIANPEYRDETSLLKIGDTVNVTLLHPILTYTYSVYQIEEVETPYEKKTITDATKAYGYSEITQSGLTGISINKETYDVVNGEASSEIKFVGTPEVIREAVTQITTVGPKYSNSVTGSYVYTDGDWGRPVNTPYRITSKYGYRWGKVHEGVDISGTGDGSPIYAIGDGEVVQVVSACSSCLRWANGNYVVIKHANGYYSAYLHLKGFNVKVGDVVTKGQVIAYMGSTGYATGVHLHLGFFKGEPYVGGTYQSFDPLKTCMKGIL